MGNEYADIIRELLSPYSLSAGARDRVRGLVRPTGALSAPARPLKETCNAQTTFQFNPMAAEPQQNTAGETKYVDHLDEDIVSCGDLRFALISFVSKNGKQRIDVDDKIGLKIRGAFATRAEADAHIKRLLKTDSMFDVYLVDMYKWLLLPPDHDKIDDVQYQERYLNDMLTEYKESQLLAKQHFQERKQLVMEQGLDKHLSNDERIPEPLADALLNDVHPTARGESSSG